MATPASPSSGSIVGTLPPPPGVVPNFDNPPRDMTAMIATTILFVLTVLFVCLRVFTNLVLTRRFGWDDGTSLVAAVLSAVVALATYELIHLGYGIDGWNIPIGDFDELLWARWSYIHDIVYPIALGIIKVSILLLYLKVFQIKRFIHWIIYGMIAFMTSFTIAGTLFIIFACKPVNLYWDLLPHGECVSTVSYGIIFGTFQISSDIVILLIPAFVILPMQLRFRQKIAAMVIFSAGIFDTVASIIRLVIIINDTSNPAAGANFTVARTRVDLWTTIELYLAIIISCMPCLRPFYSQIRIWASTISSRGSTSGPRQDTKPSTIGTRGTFFLRAGRQNHQLESAGTEEGEAGMNFHDYQREIQHDGSKGVTNNSASDSSNLSEKAVVRIESLPGDVA